METTLVYIDRDGCYLMLHRVAKDEAHDVSHGKWIGVGGKFEDGESPEECMLREVQEETGVTPLSWRYRGVVTFVSQRAETEYMHLFTVDAWKGSLRQSDEGVLEWVPKDEMNSLPHWEGDEIFLALLDKPEMSFFSLKLVYDAHDTLTDAKLNNLEVLDSWRKLRKLPVR